MTEGEARQLAKAAAKETVHELLIALGMDTDNPFELQRDLAFLRSWRQSTEAVKRQGLLVAVGVLVVGVLGLIWVAIKGAS